MAILLAIVLLGEGVTAWGVTGIALIAVGTILMVERKDVDELHERRGWLLFAIGSAVFAALTSILAKVGMEDVDSNLGTAIRTVVVLAMSWAMVAVAKKGSGIRSVAGGMRVSSSSPASPPAHHGCASSRPCRGAPPA